MGRIWRPVDRLWTALLLVRGTLDCSAGLVWIPELELTSIPIPIPELELELQAMELELELQNALAGISLLFPYFLLLMAHIDVLKMADVFFKERICFKISYCKKISVIEL